MNGCPCLILTKKSIIFGTPANPVHFKRITMNKTILAAALISGFFMAGCGSSDSPEFDRSIGPVDTAKAAPATVTSSGDSVTIPANMQATPTGSQPQAVQVQPQQVQTVATPAPAATAKGMNPPHGQPGHRCDIAVGAPLNSAPKAQIQTTASTTPQVVTTPAQVTPTSAPTVTAPGMNPPHGQPGHDCSIAVGAPLKKTN